MASEGRKRTVAVIGAGVVGVTSAGFLLRKGHDVILLDPGNAGGGASFGNAGCFNGSSVVPMSMPDTIRKVPGWLIHWARWSCAGTICRFWHLGSFASSGPGPRRKWSGKLVRCGRWSTKGSRPWRRSRAMRARRT